MNFLEREFEVGRLIKDCGNLGSDLSEGHEVHILNRLMIFLLIQAVVLLRRARPRAQTTEAAQVGVGLTFHLELWVSTWDAKAFVTSMVREFLES